MNASKNVPGLVAVSILLLVVVWFLRGEPGAQAEAKRFGRVFRATISDADLSGWTTTIVATPHPGSEFEIDIPRREWPPSLTKMLPDREWVSATLCRNSSGLPVGIRFR